MKRPILLLADEPTGNLDSASGARVLDLVDAEYDRGTTVMLITHETAVAERASRRLRIKDGIVSGG